MRRLLISLLILSLWQSRNFAADDEARIQTFIDARAKWDRSLRAFERNPNDDGTDAETATRNAFQAWERLPEGSKSGRYDQLNRMWYELSTAFAAKKKFEKAFRCLQSEIAYQKKRTSRLFPAGQGQEFFLTALRLEATILGHLGRKYYTSEVGYYFIPIEQNGAPDDFIATEATTADEQKGIQVPDLPDGKERKILYWLVADKNGDYYLKDSVQFIDDVRNPADVRVLQQQQPIVIVKGATHRVQLRNGIPNTYTELPDHTLRLQLNKSGFAEFDSR